jgi:hypothetical protein
VTKLITFGFFRGESTAFHNVNICSDWLAAIRREAAKTDKTSARIIVILAVEGILSI